MSFIHISPHLSTVLRTYLYFWPFLDEIHIKDLENHVALSLTKLFYSVRTGGIGPPPRAWQARVLPLNYVRVKLYLIQNTTNYRLLLITNKTDAPGGSRTPNLFVRSETLYPLSYGRVTSRLTLFSVMSNQQILPELHNP